MARDVRINILGDARDFARAVGQSIRESDRLDGALGRVRTGASRMAGSMALGAGAVVAAGGAMAISFVRAAEESARVTGQTNAVLESMGATAWTSAAQVEALSTALSNQTGIDDELIQSGQNVLLTFGQVQNRVGEGNDIFDRATRAALDMSTALGTDMSQASMQVGRALNDPVRGLAALRRSGIQFTTAQEDQIRAMVEAGDVAGAQRVMLAELERQFGGSAEAQATASQRLSTMWGNLQEQLGEKLLPIFEKVVDWLGQNLPGIIDTASRWFDTMGQRVAAVVALVEQHWPRIQEIIQTVVDRVREIIDTVVGYIRGAWQTFGDDIIRIATGVWEIVQQVIESAVRIVQGIINTVMGIIRGDWSLAWDGIKGIFTGIWDAITAVARGAMDIFKGIIGGALDGISTAFSNTWETILGFFQGIPGRIASIASGMWDGIKDAFRGVINWIIDAWNGLEFRIPGFDPPGPGPTFNGFTLGVPDIPRLHGGGTFRAPTPGGEGLAMLLDGERVLSRGQAANQTGAGAPIQVQVFLDGKVVVDSLVRYNKSNGPIQVKVA